MRDTSFSQALRDLKNGLKVARHGWNGKGLFVELQAIDKNSKMTMRYLSLSTPVLNGERDLIPWVPSQGDLMATDWHLVD